MIPDLPALSAEELARIGRKLVLTGNYVGIIAVSEIDGLSITPAATFDITGPHDPADWRYQVDLAGPSKSVTRKLSAASVIHVRMNAPSSTPWLGCSSLTNAGLSASFLANMELRMGQESGMRVGSVCPFPKGCRMTP